MTKSDDRAAEVRFVYHNYGLEKNLKNWLGIAVQQFLSLDLSKITRSVSREE